MGDLIEEREVPVAGHTEDEAPVGGANVLVGVQPDLSNDLFDASSGSLFLVFIVVAFRDIKAGGIVGVIIGVVGRIGGLADLPDPFAVLVDYLNNSIIAKREGSIAIVARSRSPERPRGR